MPCLLDAMLFQLLLDAGANPNQQGFTGLYPIHIAGWL